MIEAASELAQDPHSKVNPEKVEEILVEDSKEAGAAAYQFDPNASPEDKAAAAESVSGDPAGSYCSRMLIAH